MSALTEALVAAQEELPTAIERDAQGFGYRYTSLDKLIAVTRPILNKHGLTITQWPSYTLSTEGARPTLMTEIRHVGGEYVNERIPLYVTEKTMQGLGAAITYGRRYAWAAVLGIASEEDTDAATLRPEDDVSF